MSTASLTVQLDLESYEDPVYSERVVTDHIVFALTRLFGQVGAAIPFQVEDIDRKLRRIKIVTDSIFLQKLRCALTLQDQYQGVKCCFHTLDVQTAKHSETE